MSAFIPCVAPGLLLLGAVLLQSSGSPPSAPNVPARHRERRLGLAVGPAEDGDFEAAMQLALAAGVHSVPLSFGWDEIETAPSTFTDPWLAVADAYYPTKRVSAQRTTIRS
jgi:hypothetical protein